MNEVFKVILSLSCSGALLIVLLRLFRPLFRMRLSKRWQYYIWLVVVARLLLPFAPEVNLMGTLYEQIGNGIFQAEFTLPAQPNGGVVQPSAPSPADAPADQTQDQTAESERPAVSHGTNSAVQTTVKAVAAVVLQYLWLLWLITALVLFIRKVTIYQSFVKYIRAGCVEVEDIGLLERFGGLVAQSGVKAAVDLSVNPLISSPLLVGFFRPRIVLPTTELSDSDFQFTILHELTHFKRLDMFYKWLVQAAVCIHWFNPLAWLMKCEVERVCELACDEAVIRSLDAAGRRAYGDTLLNAIGAGGHYKESVAAVTLCESQRLLSERLAAISGFQKKSAFVRAFSIVLAGAVCWGAVSAGAYAVAPLPSFSGEVRSTVELALAEGENTTESVNVSIAATTQADHVMVVRGGDTLRIEYYSQNPDENNFKLLIPLSSGSWQGLAFEFFAQDIADYQLQPIASDDSSEIKMRSVGRSDSSDMGLDRWVKITVPEQLPLDELEITTKSGSIRVTDVAVKDIQTSTQDGQIDIVGGDIHQYLSLRTESGNALISGTVLPVKEIGKENGKTQINTQSGVITVQPKDHLDNYCLEIDYGDEANLMINDMCYVETATVAEEGVKQEDGSVLYSPEAMQRMNRFTVQREGASVIYFTSPEGALQMLGE